MEIKKMDNNEQKEYPDEEAINESIIKRHLPVKWVALGITAVTIATVGTCVYFANAREVEMVGDYQSPAFMISNARIEGYNGKQSGSNIISLISEIRTLNISNLKEYNIKFTTIGWKNSSGEDINLNTSNADDTYLSNAMASVVKNHLYTVALEYDARRGNITNVIVTY